MLIPNYKYRSGRLLSYILLEVTQSCNLRCRHCYINAAFNKRNNLELNEIKKVLREAADLGVVGIGITGGEPFIRKDIHEILKYAADLGLYVQIFTNGTLLTKYDIQMLAKLGEYLDRMRVSLYGTRDIHDYVTGVRGSYDLTVRNIKLMLRENLPVAINFTITKPIMDKLDEAFASIKSTGVEDIVYGIIFPQGRASENNDLLFEFSDLIHLYKKLYKMIVKDNIINYSNIMLDINNISRNMEKMKILSKEYRVPVEGLIWLGSCGAGASFLYINTNGDVYPCNKIYSIKLGNIKQILRSLASSRAMVS
ncbi:radical SAM protein [Pyrodictium abyssi]